MCWFSQANTNQRTLLYPPLALVTISNDISYSELPLFAVNGNKKEEQLDLLSYLAYDMERKIIKSIKLPKLDKSYVYQSYKVSLERAKKSQFIILNLPR